MNKKLFKTTIKKNKFLIYVSVYLCFRSRQDVLHKTSLLYLHKNTLFSNIAHYKSERDTRIMSISLWVKKSAQTGSNNYLQAYLLFCLLNLKQLTLFSAKSEKILTASDHFFSSKNKIPKYNCAYEEWIKINIKHINKKKCNYLNIH